MTQGPVLETQRLILRRPDERDIAPMLAFFGSDRALFYGGPMDEAKGWVKFAAYAGQWLLRGYGFFAVTDRATGATVGLAGPHHPVDFAEPEMSWLLTDAAYEGKGLAGEACQAVLDHLFVDLGWTNVVSYIDLRNDASRNLAIRLGALPDPDANVPLEGCEAYRHRPRAVVVGVAS